MRVSCQPHTTRYRTSKFFSVQVTNWDTGNLPYTGHRPANSSGNIYVCSVTFQHWDLSGVLSGTSEPPNLTKETHSIHGLLEARPNYILPLPHFSVKHISLPLMRYYLCWGHRKIAVALACQACKSVPQPSVPTWEACMCGTVACSLTRVACTVKSSKGLLAVVQGGQWASLVLKLILCFKVICWRSTSSYWYCIRWVEVILINNVHHWACNLTLACICSSTSTDSWELTSLSINIINVDW